MTRGGHWSGVGERGSMGALRAGAWLYRVLGQRMFHLLLYPIAAYFLLRDGSRRASRRYLEQVWAHPEGRRHLRGRPGRFAPFWHYHEFGVQLLDRLMLWSGGIDRFQMDHRGSEHLFARLREGRGALLLGSHLGSFDMARQLASEYRVPINVVMFTAHAERINHLFEQAAPESQVRVLQLDPGSLRTAFEIRACLGRGEMVGILADRVPAGGRERPVFAEFLGRRAPFPLSPFRLACLLGCPVLFSVCVRTGDARYETVVEPLTEGRRLPRREREKGAEELARAYVRRLEAACLRFPYQWFNFFDVWDTRGAV